MCCATNKSNNLKNTCRSDGLCAEGTTNLVWRESCFDNSSRAVTIISTNGSNNNTITIALGVGLGVGIPLLQILCAIVLLQFRNRNSNVAPSNDKSWNYSIGMDQKACQAANSDEISTPLVELPGEQRP
jgi:hypothetical protein